MGGWLCKRQDAVETTENIADAPSVDGKDSRIQVNIEFCGG